MLELFIFQIDAFSDEVFKGNPACVVPLGEWLPDEKMLQIAKENAVAETAFFIIRENHVDLRWFTPEVEMDLCGHATLAAAHCLMEEMEYSKESIEFKTMSGTLIVSRSNGFYHLDFPSRAATEVPLPELISISLSIQPMEVYKSRDYLLVYNSEEEIKELQINRNFFDQVNIDKGGVIATAKGENCDFVSRFFTPRASVFEDPVTGSAHCTLVPYWTAQSNKISFEAQQLSERGGKLHCENQGERIIISGKASTYLKGKIFVQK